LILAEKVLRLIKNVLLFLIRQGLSESTYTQFNSIDCENNHASNKKNKFKFCVNRRHGEMLPSRPYLTIYAKTKKGKTNTTISTQQGCVCV